MCCMFSFSELMLYHNEYYILVFFFLKEVFCVLYIYIIYIYVYVDGVHALSYKAIA